MFSRPKTLVQQVGYHFLLQYTKDSFIPAQTDRLSHMWPKECWHNCFQSVITLQTLIFIFRPVHMINHLKITVFYAKNQSLPCQLNRKILWVFSKEQLTQLYSQHSACINLHHTRRKYIQS